MVTIYLRIIYNKMGYSTTKYDCVYSNYFMRFTKLVNSILIVRIMLDRKTKIFCGSFEFLYLDQFLESFGLFQSLLLQLGHSFGLAILGNQTSPHLSHFSPFLVVVTLISPMMVYSNASIYEYLIIVIFR